MQLIECYNGKKRYLLTDEECRDLFTENNNHMQHRYPNPKTGYVATVLCEDGSMFTGVSYGSDTETLTMHGEMTALSHAAIHGQTKIVAISGPNCHICKQLIYESTLRSSIDTLIVTEENGHFIQTPISKLMPQPWPIEPK